MHPRFTLVVDESGQSGIKRVRTDSAPGASPYMTLGAALFAERDREKIQRSLKEVGREVNRPDLHCSHMKHEKIAYFARCIARERICLFGLISRKEKLKEGYGDRIRGDDKLYYNKCAIYLLERVGHFMKTNDLPTNCLSVIFEQGNYDYGALKNFVRACQATPHTQQAKLLEYIDASRIYAKPKEEEDCLKIADLVAHALYKAVDKNSGNYGIPETKYLAELQHRFFGDQDDSGRVLGAGLKVVHKLKDLALDQDIVQFLQGMKASAKNRRLEEIGS